MSGPPQLKSLKKGTVVRQLGECGGHIQSLKKQSESKGDAP
jgi:hypothetical protein